VENRRCSGGRVVRRPVLYLGEINDSQREAWIRSIEVFDEDARCQKRLKLFASEREMPRAWPMPCRCGSRSLNYGDPAVGSLLAVPSAVGATGTAEFWSQQLGTSREGTDWEHVPGKRSAMSFMLG
jgi:hypothetical protein